MFYKTYVKLFRRITETLTELLFEGNASRTFLLVKELLKQIKIIFWLAAKVELRFNYLKNLINVAGVPQKKKNGQ